MLAQGVADFPESVHVPKSDNGERIRNLRGEIMKRIAAGQTDFAIVDFYMGGVFAGELLKMIRPIVETQPGVRFEVMWMRETHGFDRLTVRPEPGKRLKPSLGELERGVATGSGMRLQTQESKILVKRADGSVIEVPAPKIKFLLPEGPGVVVPAPHGTDAALAQRQRLRVTEYPVQVALGDDMDTVVDGKATHPITLYDREGRTVRQIPVGTIDPATGQPLRTTKEILMKLIEDPDFDGKGSEDKR